MKKVLASVLCFGLVGCATLSESTAINRTNLLKLSVGMTKAEAISNMGTEAATAYFQDIGGYHHAIAITNPYRSETLQGKDKIFEVVYYVTDDKANNGAIVDDDLTPLVFENGKLIGWGYRFLQDNAQKYEIRIR